VAHGSLEILPQLAECTPPTRRKEIKKDETAESMAACKATRDALFSQRFVPRDGEPAPGDLRRAWERHPLAHRSRSRRLPLNLQSGVTYVGDKSLAVPR
jgi:hypothetical protein